MSQNTAILVFTRTASEEADVKQWVSFPSRKKNFSIAQYLIEQSISKARATQLPVFIIESPQQHGSGFGERFTNAFNEIFQKGFDSVISMGTDCPGITTDILLKTHALLQSQQVVIGPDKRGGIYLLGMHRSYFNATSFLKFSWQTPLLRDNLLAYMKRIQVTVNLLCPLHDFHHRIHHTSNRQLTDIVGKECCRYILKLLGEGQQLFTIATRGISIKEVPATSLTSPPLQFAPDLY